MHMSSLHSQFADFFNAIGAERTWKLPFIDVFAL